MAVFIVLLLFERVLLEALLELDMLELLEESLRSILLGPIPIV
jgi:hypothetical protein